MQVCNVIKLWCFDMLSQRQGTSCESGSVLCLFWRSYSSYRTATDHIFLKWFYWIAWNNVWCRAFHSLAVVGKKLFPNVLDECLILRNWLLCLREQWVLCMIHVYWSSGMSMILLYFLLIWIVSHPSSCIKCFVLLFQVLGDRLTRLESAITNGQSVAPRGDTEGDDIDHGITWHN